MTPGKTAALAAPAALRAPTWISTTCKPQPREASGNGLAAAGGWLACQGCAARTARWRATSVPSRAGMVRILPWRASAHQFGRGAGEARYRWPRRPMLLMWARKLPEASVGSLVNQMRT